MRQRLPAHNNTRAALIEGTAARGPAEEVHIHEDAHFWKALGYILDHRKHRSAVRSEPTRQPPPDESPDPGGLLIE